MHGQTEELNLLLSQLKEREHLDSLEVEIILEGFNRKDPGLDFRTYLLNEMADLSAYHFFQGINMPYPRKNHQGAASLLMSSVGSTDDFFPDKEAQKKIMWKLSSDLVELGLASKKSELEIMASVGNNVVPEAGILMFYAFMSMELSKIPAKRKKQVERIGSYQNAGVLVDKFEESPANNDPTSVEAFDLVPYFVFSTIVRLNELSAEPVAGFKEIFEKVLAVCPDNGISVSDISVRNEREDEYLRMFVSVRLDVDGAVVSDTFSSIVLKDRKTGLRTPRTELISEIVTVINKALIFKDVPYRSYYFKPGQVGLSGDSIGLAYLTKNQYLVIKEPANTHFMSGPHPELTMSPIVMEELLREGQQLGLVPQSANIAEARDTLKSLADLVRAYGFTEKNALFEKPLKYGNILRQLTRLSKGAFNATNIEESVNEENDKLIITFDLDGKARSVTASDLRGRFYIDFLRNLGKLVSDLNLKGDFYSIGIQTEDVGEAYLTDEQEKWLSANTNIMWIGKHLR